LALNRITIGTHLVVNILVGVAIQWAGIVMMRFATIRAYRDDPDPAIATPLKDRTGQDIGSMLAVFWRTEILCQTNR
jgi:hypothetical protein